MTKKTFLYSNSALTLVLQIGLSLPCLAMDKDTEQKFHVPVKGSSSSTSTSSSSTTLSKKSSPPPFDSLSLSSSISSSSSNPPSYSSSFDSMCSSVCPTKSQIVATSKYVVKNDEQSKLDQIKSTDKFSEKWIKGVIDLSVSVASGRAKTTTSSEAISLLDEVIKHKETKQEVLWRAELSKANLISFQKDKEGEYYRTGANIFLKHIENENIPEDMRMEARLTFGLMRLQGHTYLITQQEAYKHILTAAKSKKTSNRHKATAQAQLIQDLESGYHSLITLEEACSWAKRIRDDVTIRPQKREDAMNARERLKKTIADKKRLQAKREAPPPFTSNTLSSSNSTSSSSSSSSSSTTALDLKGLQSKAEKDAITSKANNQKQ